jgi:glycosyltransferase involved in cell wall biosynthesis
MQGKAMNSSNSPFVYPFDTWNIDFKVRAAELCRRCDYVKAVPLFHRNRLVRGLERRFLLPYFVRKLSQRHPFMWCNGVALIPYFSGDIVVDLDDPHITPEETALLNDPRVRAVVVTTDMMREALKIQGLEKEIVVIPSGVDIKSIENPIRRVERPPEKDVKIIGYVSKRIKSEEIDTLVRILDDASQAGLKVQLWLVGNTNDHRLSRQDIRFFGYILDHRDIFNIIRCFDLSLYIRHDDYGGRFSIKLIESFACGVPVVSVESSEAFLITESGAGLICPRHDLSPAVLALLKDSPRRNNMAERGRCFAADYDWDRIARVYREKVLEPLLGRRG